MLALIMMPALVLASLLLLQQLGRLSARLPGPAACALLCWSQNAPTPSLAAHLAPSAAPALEPASAALPAPSPAPRLGRHADPAVAAMPGCGGWALCSMSAARERRSRRCCAAAAASGEGALAVSSSQGEASSASCTCKDQARSRRCRTSQLKRH